MESGGDEEKRHYVSLETVRIWGSSGLKADSGGAQVGWPTPGALLKTQPSFPSR